MIKIEFHSAVTIYLIIAISLVFGLWIFYNYKKDIKITSQSEDMHQCPYCTHIFFDSSEEDYRTCPKCRSYITIDKIDTLNS